jgi:excisionase family DNA binding protein
MNAHRQLLVVDEVADFLRVKSSTVYEWAKNGKIPARKVGRLWRFSREDIEVWMRESSPRAGRQLSGLDDDRIA